MGNRSLIFAILIVLLVSVEAVAALVPKKVEASVKKQIESVVLQRNPFLEKGDTVVTIVNPRVFSRIPKHAETFALEVDGNRRLLGRSVLQLQLFDQNNKIIEKKTVVVETTAKTTFFRTKKQVKRGELLTLDHVEEVVESLYGRHPLSIHKRENILGKEAMTVIAKGTIVTDRMIQSVPVVRRGKIVTAVVNGEGVQIKVKARALQDGQKGEMIKVKSMSDSKRILEGVVIDAENVQIYI